MFIYPSGEDTYLDMHYQKSGKMGKIALLVGAVEILKRWKEEKVTMKSHDQTWGEFNFV